MERKPSRICRAAAYLNMVLDGIEETAKSVAPVRDRAQRQ